MLSPPLTPVPDLIQCDDGNNRSADGCSSSCTIEQGFSCSAQPGKPDLCVCEMDAAECCVRRYGSCMAVTPESCSATCFDNLTVCLRDAQSAPRASPDTIVDASAAEVGASAAETTEGVEALNLTQWAQAEPLQCNRTAMKRCREEFAGCQNTVSQQQQLLQQGSVAASAALLPNSAGIGAGGEGGCSAASCLQRFVRCMRITACPDYTKIVADGMA
jgi:cysteine-rich repeat protein